jgi:predicted metal-dependent phosphoesterase TrpH
VIDLHLHTTASDGACAPATLVDRAWMAGLRTIAVTDHDTTGGLPEAARAAAARGLRLVTGIEVTSVVAGRDVHLLGYFFDPDHPPLVRFLEAQRADRVNRAREIGRRLAALGKPVDLDPLLGRAEREPGFSVGRPSIAQALVDAGHVIDLTAAFDAWLGDGQPAYVPRAGASPGEVAAIVRAAGGIVSLAHPVLLRDQSAIPAIAGELDAIEVYHSEHRAADTARYVAIARGLGLAVSGGSDFHGETRGTRAVLGLVTLPGPEFDALAARRPGARGTAR